MVRVIQRIRFRKTGDLRFLSHLDLKRCFERLFRRADLPVLQSQGFHARPRVSFPSALSLGVDGLDEIVELELSEPLPPEVVLHRLAGQAPPGLTFTTVTLASRPARLARATYRIDLPPDRLPGLGERCADLLARTELIVERAGPPAKRVDLRPYLLSLTLTAHTLELRLRLTPGGTARPAELLALLGLADLLSSGTAHLARTALELEDFTPSGPPDAATNAAAPDATPTDRNDEDA